MMMKFAGHVARMRTWRMYTTFLSGNRIEGLIWETKTYISEYKMDSNTLNPIGNYMYHTISKGEFCNGFRMSFINKRDYLLKQL